MFLYSLSFPSSINQPKGERKHSKQGIRARMVHALREFFLPAGYPDTVSSDYWPFHRWWILSSLAGAANYVLSMQCLLTAVGMPAIGSVPISAGISWVLKDGLGSLMSMFVAGRFARRFDVEPKSSKWRADLLHNVGVGVEILTPLFPAYFLLMASLANTLKGVAGLISGATRASFNRGFAVSENLGEVTAKAQGQGIAAYLLGMGLGIGLSFLWPVQNLTYTFPLFVFLAAVHLVAGYYSLCNVTLTSLNQQRAFLLIQQYVRAAAQQAMMARIETPDEVRLRERFVAGTRPWLPDLILGAPLSAAFPSGTAALTALQAYASKRYIITLAPDNSGRILVLLKKEAEARDVLEGLFHAVVVMHQQPVALQRTPEHLQAALPFVKERFNTFFAQLSTSQWKDSDLLLYAVGRNRISIVEEKQP